MSKADGSVIIATIIDTEGIERGTVEIEKDLLKVGKGADKANESVGGSLAGGFKKLGKAIAAAGVVDMIVDFGKEAIDLGSDLEEVQNVVDVTFSTMSDKVNKFAKDAQKTAGLSETMAKQYVGTFGAMADSFGFAEVEAYEMSTALTQLTGDVASFYNLSQDEAATKLKGVFTGETEALKELGVVMTQTALDSYAMANGFGKTTDAMSEQEKVALRYQFVMDQLSAASGDFVRTQDSWANQSRLLSLQWESLMATLGTGLIDILSPALAFLNDTVMPALQKAADGVSDFFDAASSNDLEKTLKRTAKSMGDIEEQYESTREEIEKTAVKSEFYRSKLYDLEEAGLDSAESQREYANVVSLLNGLYPDLNLQIDAHTGLLDADSQAILKNMEAMEEQMYQAAAEEKINAIREQRIQLELALAEAQAHANDLSQQRTDIETQLQAATGLTIAQLQELANAQNQAAAAAEAGQNPHYQLAETYGATTEAALKLTDEQLKQIDYATQLMAAETAQKALMDETTNSISAKNTEMENLRKTYGLVEEASGGVAAGQKQISSITSDVTQKVTDLQTALAESTKSARASIDSQIGIFDEFSANTDLNAKKILANWETQQTGLQNYETNLQTLLERGYMDDFVAQLATGETEMIALAQALVDDTSIKVDDFNAEWERTKEARDSVAEIMGQINSDVAGKFEEMYESVDSSWDDIEESTRLAALDIMESINSLKGKKIYIDTYYRSFGNTNGSVAGGSKTRTIDLPASMSMDVPYLASGAVIPPNAPFMAVLGDQRRGVNVEAPLTTIQEAVANVVNDAIMSGFAANIKAIQSLHDTLKNVEIGDTVIGEAVERYNWKNNIIRGGPL